MGQTSFAKYVAKLIDEREKEGDTSSPFLAHAVAVCADQAVIAALEGFSVQSAALPTGGMAEDGGRWAGDRRADDQCAAARRAGD